MKLSKYWDEWGFSHLQWEKAEKQFYFRSELDALPIDEINTSNIDDSGVCGHDGHMVHYVV
jgi:metal-dependent amidase/aminoacylase/carboxypeptidase family protein